jgi:outer membrane protein OmpA-like peptidoglycan-associated protein
VLGLFGVGVVDTAAAQSRPDIDTQNFQPVLQPHGIFTVEESTTLDHLQPAGTLIFDYLSEPLVEDRGGETRAIVDQQLTADVLAGIGLFDRLQIAAHLPVYLVNNADYRGSDLGGVGVGDLSVRPKVRILTQEQAGIGLGAAVNVSFPTGQGDAFIGASSVTATPELIIDRRIGRAVISGNFGVRVEKNETWRNLKLGDAFTYGIGTEVAVVENLFSLGAEVYGETPLRDFWGSSATSPLEILVGAKFKTKAGIAVMAGSGAGIVSGVGAPEFRAFLGVSYPTKAGDADGDGIMDAQDECKNEPEDLDGFQDADGCPDPDNDGDGIPDDKDMCPDKAEDMNGYEDKDGCPDAEKDTDGDGIPDVEDNCIDQPEDMNGYQDEDGCPDGETDSDGDGIKDANDDCVDAPEDKDGFEDEDGCPDEDNDNDGIADAADECPMEPGLEENDGCPAEEQKAVREEEEIKILEKVYFESDSARIKQASFDVLNQVALVIRSNPDISKVEIQGHTDSTGDETYNQELSAARAESVKAYLVKRRGIDASRLVAKGYGESKPIVSNDSAENRSKNRRVEFKILEEGGDPESTEEESPED